MHRRNDYFPAFKERKQHSSLRARRRSKSSPHHERQSRSPYRSSKRNDSQTRYFERDESRSHYLEKSRSPPHYRRRGKSPAHYRERGQSPAYYRGRSTKSPNSVVRRGKASVPHLERSRSPVQYWKRSISPYHDFEKSHHLRNSETPTRYLEKGMPSSKGFEVRNSPDHGWRSKSPTYYREKSNSPVDIPGRSNAWEHHLERNRSPVYYLNRSLSPSAHDIEESHYLKNYRTSPLYFEKGGSPSQSFKERNSPNHYGRRSKSPIFLETSRSSMHHLERSRSPVYYLNRSMSPSAYDIEKSDYLRNSRNSPEYFEKGEFPSDHLRRSQSPSFNLERRGSYPHYVEEPQSSSLYFARSQSPVEGRRSPSYYQDISKPSQYLEMGQFPSQPLRSPAHYLERSKSPPHYLDRRKSPSYDRSKSPSHFLQNSLPQPRTLEVASSPDHYLQTSKSPSDIFKRSQFSNQMGEKGTSPSHHFERSMSRSHSLEGSPPPSHFLKESESNYFKKHEPSLERSPTPSHFLKESGSNYFEKHEPFLERSPPPSHFSKESGSNYFEKHEPSFDNPPCEVQMDELPDLNRNVQQNFNNDMHHSKKIRKGPIIKEKGGKLFLYGKKYFHDDPTSYLYYNTVKLRSVEHVDELTYKEVHAIHMSGAACRKVKALTNEGIDETDAKRKVLKEIYLREKQNRPKALRLPKDEDIVELQASFHKNYKFPTSKPTARVGFKGAKTKNSGFFQRVIVPVPMTESSVKPSVYEKRPGIEQNPVNVAVIHSGYPQAPLNMKKLKMVNAAIMFEYDHLSSSGPKVRFTKTDYKSGYLVITCENKRSADWLKKLVPQLKPWHGAVLRTQRTKQDKSTIPKDPTIPSRPVKCTVFVRDEEERLSSEMIMARLKAQNQGLNTQLWMAVGKTAKATGVLWMFAMDSESLEYLKKLEMKPYCGLERVTFKHLVGQ